MFGLRGFSKIGQMAHMSKLSMMKSVVTVPKLHFSSAVV